MWGIVACCSDLWEDLEYFLLMDKVIEQVQ